MIKKAIIPAAGLGTRFIPATLGVPKELFPIFDKPLLMYALQELAEAGVEEVGVIISPYKENLKQFISPNPAIINKIDSSQKEELKLKIQEWKNLPKITWIEQKEPLGLGHAVLQGKEFINNEAFLVLLPDELFLKDNNQKTNISEKLVKLYQEDRVNYVALLKVPEDKVSSYGIAKFKGSLDSDLSVPISDLVEKPSIEKAPSQYALPGRYLLEAEVFKILEKLGTGAGGEIQLTDALITLAHNQQLKGCKTETNRFDCGGPKGLLDAQNFVYNQVSK